MNIRIKEPLYISCHEQKYVIRSGTIGVEHNRVVFFYDITKTIAVGFSRDFCLESPQTFQVSRTLSDKEISQRDVLKILDGYNQKEYTLEEVYEYIKSL